MWQSANKGKTWALEVRSAVPVIGCLIYIVGKADHVDAPYIPPLTQKKAIKNNENRPILASSLGAAPPDMIATATPAARRLLQRTA